MERIKSRLLPMLKGNQLLIDWFMQCLGGGAMTPSNRDEYETLVLRKTHETVDDDSEMFEYIPQSEIVADPNDNPCQIRYMNGHLFYGNRFPLPAKLSFSMNPCNSNETTAETYAEPRQLNEKNEFSSYRCVHNIKQFGDSKIRDVTNNHVEFDGNNVSEEFDNSDDEQICITPVDKIDEKNSLEEEVEQTSPITSTAANALSDQVLCDDFLMKAHSFRLNPATHTSIHNNNTDLLNRLKQNNTNELYVRSFFFSF